MGRGFNALASWLYKQKNKLDSRVIPLKWSHGEADVNKD